MMTRALVQNLVLIGMLSTLQEVCRITQKYQRADCEGESTRGYTVWCGNEAYSALRSLGEQPLGDGESQSHKDVYP